MSQAGCLRSAELTSAYPGQVSYHPWSIWNEMINPGQEKAAEIVGSYYFSRSTSACLEQCSSLLCFMVYVSRSGPDLYCTLIHGASLIFQHIAHYLVRTS